MINLARRGALAAAGAGAGALPAGVGAHATMSANVSYSYNTWVALPLNTETFDTHGFHDNAVNNTRFTCPAGEAGYYLVGGNWRGQGSYEKRRLIIAVWKNGVGPHPGTRYEQNTSSTGAPYIGALAGGLVQLAVGDYVEVRMYTSNEYTTTFEAGPIGAWILKVGT